MQPGGRKRERSRLVGAEKMQCHHRPYDSRLTTTGPHDHEQNGKREPGMEGDEKDTEVCERETLRCAKGRSVAGPPS